MDSLVNTRKNNSELIINNTDICSNSKMKKKNSINENILSNNQKTRRNINELDKKKISNNSNMKKSNAKNYNKNNVISLSNISNTNLLNDKNDTIFRKLMKKDNIKNDINNTAINKINSLYKNKFFIKLKLKDDSNIKKIKKNNHNLITNNSNTVKINNFFKTNTFNNNKNSISKLKDNFLHLEKNQCFICETKKEKLYHTKQCNHFFCNECGRCYFEQQIDKGIFSLKCLKYDCNKNLLLNDIKSFLNPEIISKIQTHIKNNKSNKINFINNDNYESSNIERGVRNFIFKSQITNSINKSNYSLHFMIKKHIIKNSNDTRFKSKVKNEKEMKKVICSKCSKSALFSRDNMTYIRCLNCCNAICKFCYRHLDSYNIQINAICGLCFNEYRFHKKQTITHKFIFEIIYIISGFIIVWIGFSKYEALFFVSNKRGKKYYLFIFFFIIFLLFNIIFFVLFIPYFPIINSFFGY